METHEIEHRERMKLIGIAAMVSVMVFVIIVAVFIIPGMFQPPPPSGG